MKLLGPCCCNLIRWPGVNRRGRNEDDRLEKVGRENNEE